MLSLVVLGMASPVMVLMKQALDTAQEVMTIILVLVHTILDDVPVLMVLVQVLQTAEL